MMKIRELFRDEKKRDLNTDIVWELREICINPAHIVRVIPVGMDIKGNCSEALKQLSPAVTFIKIIFNEGAHASSCFAIGAVSDFVK
jgi:hypothetical protein